MSHLTRYWLPLIGLLFCAVASGQDAMSDFANALNSAFSSEQLARAELIAQEEKRLEQEIAELNAQGGEDIERRIAAARERSEARLEQQQAELTALLEQEQQSILSLQTSSAVDIRVQREVDPRQHTERALLLLPEGPIVLEMTLLVEGEPYQLAQEQLLEDILAVIPPNEDGELTWKSAVEIPEFRLGTYATRRTSPLPEHSLLREALREFDKDQDELVDRDEARLYLASAAGGNVFTAYDFGQSYGVNASEQDEYVFGLLDTDASGDLSSLELAAARAVLKGRDRDDNDSLTSLELSENQSDVLLFVDSGRSSWGLRSSRSQGEIFLWTLGPTADWNAIWPVLRDRYAQEGELNQQSFPLDPDLLAALDRNENRLLDRAELAGFNEVEPHISLSLNVGEPSGATPAIQLESRIPFQSEAAWNRDNVRAFQLAGVQVVLEVDSTPQDIQQVVSTQAENFLRGFDYDNNGYVEKAEFPVDAQSYYESQIERFDVDSDGKVYLEEYEEVFRRTSLPRFNRLSLAGVDKGHSFFSVLDSDGNGTLGERELENLEQQLSAYQGDDDVLVVTELPRTLHVVVGRTSSIEERLLQRYVRYSYVPLNYNQQADGGTSQGPAWFRAADSNNDGDLSRREFLGPSEQFAAIDGNDDGFIDLAEAATAGE